MKRIDTTTRAPNLFGAGKDGFRDGDLAGGISPTDFNADWANNIQEEIAGAIEAGGLVLDPADRGQLAKAFRGRLIGVQTFEVVGAFTYTPSPGTKSVIVEVQAGGGGAAGTTTTTASTVSYTGGGGAGSYGKRRITAAFSGVTVTVGAGGAPGAVNGPGGAGGASSFGALVTTNGGSGSVPFTGPAGTFGIGNAGGVGSVLAPGAQQVVGGERGSPGMSVGVSLFGGEGGSSAFGAGGAGGGNPGNNATSWGTGGGGGAINPSIAGAAGAAGRQGAVIVWEYS